jgi:hypothetical protein
MASTAAKACPHCKAPWERITEKQTTFEGGSGRAGATADEVNAVGKWDVDALNGNHNLKLDPVNSHKTVGWKPTCQCPDNDGTGRCTVLDTFNGAATTGLVALARGCDYIGSDLNEDYLRLSVERLAPGAARRRLF